MTRDIERVLARSGSRRTVADPSISFARRLQLWNREDRVVRREGDPLDVAHWLQACHNAGIEVRVQVNESVTP
ncbi:TPA: hypothetical protein OEI94_004882 [Escherichia coli]|uniref:hypothetical protein n=1 Tax=Escherichia coli TaxID=562 RepID=UPI00198D3CCC|nr:hypothetical protein [Escherichia coli]HCP5812570.1 hypothetical protein [Escherichia coli]HCP5903665.1 hypothetical protein [Escherichia coli]